MGFIDSYKHLEKICGEIMCDDRKVSAYIDEMTNNPRGPLYVKGWENDLKKLKHYRWIRNQIVHDPDCSEENMCNHDDVDWLDGFYNRIMSQTDPLALYRKEKIRHTKSNSTDKTYTPPTYTYKTPKKPMGCSAFVLPCFIILLFLMIFFWLNFLT